MRRGIAGGIPIGQFKEPVTIVPAADDLRVVRQAIAAGGRSS